MKNTNKLDHQWTRVHGNDLDKGNAVRRKKNQDLLNSPHFQEVCRKLDLKATLRQASKCNNKYGRVYNFVINRGRVQA